MEVKYTCTYWGCENKSVKEFISDVLQNGYQGVEINLPDDAIFVRQFTEALEEIKNTTDPDFIFIAQQVLPSKKESVNDYINRVAERLTFLTSLKPDFINSHTGKDFFSFEDNCRIIKIVEDISIQSGIPVWHEIHRGRFTFHLQTLLKYFDVFSDLKLTADFSHFCVVSESNLEDQYDRLQQIYPAIKHIHARVGFEQSAQVNNPFAPEWSNYLQMYITWWKEIIEVQKRRNNSLLTITPEFGPFPYMPQEPFTKKSLSDQWEVNLQMKKLLNQKFLENG
jgi:hypothetical protein